MSSREITTAFLPVYKNPYQLLLEKALQPNGITIEHYESLPTYIWLKQAREKVQILHFHWLYGLYMQRYLSLAKWIYFLLWFHTAKWFGYRIVWTAHNIIPHNLPFPLMHLSVRRLMMRHAHAVITHCEYGKKELLHRFPRQDAVHVIPIGSYEGVYPNIVGRLEARSKLNIAKDRFVYLFLGNISQYKGLKNFIVVFQESATESDLAVIAGRNRAPNLVEEISEMTKSDDRFRIHADFIPDKEMQYFLNAADVMVAPFQKILTSSSVMVGLSFGLPVIVPDLGCMPELVRPEAGIVYKANDNNSLRDALSQIKKMDLSTIGKAAKAISQSLRWDEIGRQTADVYHSVLY